MKLEQSLYEVLGVEKTATHAEIRKAYLKLSLQLHPDKNQDDPDAATARFQALQKCYAILSDEEKRKVYDQTGSIEDSEELTSDKFKDLYEYYKDQFVPVTEETINQFSTKYRHSAEERTDVLYYYEKYKGDMRHVFDWVMLSDSSQDSHRFMDILEESIEKQEVERYKKYDTWAKKIAKKPRPAPKTDLPEATEATGEGSKGAKVGKGKKRSKKQSGGGSDGDMAGLMALMAQRNSSRGSALDALAAKYGVDTGSMGNDNDEPTEEDFQAARERLEKTRAGSGGSASKKSKTKK